ncbi:hypothetical protein BHM03_00043099 [Ensete ventricosum]|nr:hypothetical protein BHM03_00043099 [Ensete ventricosum]
MAAAITLSTAQSVACRRQPHQAVVARGGSRVQQGPRMGLPQATDCNHGGNSRAGKPPPCAAEAAQAAASHTTGGNRMPAAGDTQPCASGRVGHNRALVAAQASATVEGKRRIMVFS